MADPNASVRDTAVECLVDMYIYGGDRWLLELQSKHKHSVPDAKFPAILARFSDCKSRGLVGADGQVVARPTGTEFKSPTQSSSSARTPLARGSTGDLSSGCKWGVGAPIV